MQKKQFLAVGWESKSLSPGFVFLLIGALQVFPVLALSQLGSWYSGIYSDAVGPSLLLLVLSLVGGAHMSRRAAGRNFVGTYKVSFTNRKAEGGEVEMAYVDPKGMMHNSLIVKSLKAEESSLYRPMWGGPRPVEGTSAALKIRFKGKQGGLNLGFSSVEEMDSVYEGLK